MVVQHRLPPALALVQPNVADRRPGRPALRLPTLQVLLLLAVLLGWALVDRPAIPLRLLLAQAPQLKKMQMLMEEVLSETRP
jgi:hypothetical protein